MRQPTSITMLLAIGAAAGLCAVDVESFTLDFPFAPATTWPSGETITTGLGSAGFHRHTDPAWSVYTVTDRGPNADFTGVVNGVAVAGKQYPAPWFTPAIYHLELKHDRLRVLARIPLLDDNGIGVSGLPNPLQAPALTETAFDVSGGVLPLDPGGLDTEGIVRMPDGTFWLADENAPSLVHVDAGGHILNRCVPAGVESSLAGAHYQVSGTLPTILRLRRVNRGFESIAVSPSGALYTALQSPLDNPADSTKPKPKPRDSRTVRVLRVDPASGSATAEWAYVCDSFETFLDPLSTKQGDIKVSEMAMVDESRFILLERTDFRCKLFLVDLNVPATDLLGSTWDGEAKRPTLEQVNLANEGIVPLSKTLLFDQNVDAPGLPNKIESVVIMRPGLVLLINDNDFGLGGARTTFTYVALPPRTTN